MSASHQPAPDRKYKGTILMDPFFATGHLNPFQTLGEWLVKEGYRVVFICPIHHNGTAISNNFEYFHLSPFLFLPDKLELKQKGGMRYFLENIFESRYKRSYQTFKKVTSDYDKLIKEIKPGLILLDDHHAHKALFYQKYGTKIATVSALLLPLMTAKSPPFQTTYIPKDTILSSSIIKYLWIKNHIKRYVKSSLIKFRCLGNSDLRLMKSFCAHSSFTYDSRRSFGVGISEIPMIATYSKPLDFSNNIFELIEKRRTGSPRDLANRLNVTERTVYNIMDSLKMTLEDEIIYSDEYRSYIFLKKKQVD